MKTNKEFINGIYEKYDEYAKEKQQNRQRNIMQFVNMAAVIIVLISSLIVFSGKDTPKQVEHVDVFKDDIETNSTLKTVGNFENFYEVIKEKYASSQNIQFSEADSITEDLAINESTADETKTTVSTSSETNTQVENVDEADIVKVDDRYIYYVSDKKIVIIDAQNSENSEKIAEINYEDANFNPREIYVKSQKLIVIGNEYDNTCKSDGIVTEDIVTSDIAVATDFKQKSGIIIYDISNIKEPQEVRRVMVEGNYISSRMIGNNVYFVANKYIYSSNILKNQLEDLDENEYKPRYQDTAVSKEEKCIDYDSIYCLDGTQDTSYLMLIGVNINNNEEADIRTFLGAGQYIYASEKNMYIATNKNIYGEGYEVMGGTTHILKFGLENGKFTFKAETDVDGQVNNQFSMDENGDTFRIATTTSLWYIDENTSNNLYILNGKLEEVGKITGFAKEEKIYSVRYVGDKAYVVTFKQTDPLFVIDLSVPTNPQILGELKIPGYSTYLHPYDETHLIGFGYDTKENGTQITTNGLKMAMFDVSDLNNPKELFKIAIGDSKYTYSELLYNHKALLFSKEKNIIAFPLRAYEKGKINTRAAIYEIDLEKGFILKGEIANTNDKYDEQVERIVFVNNTYYTLSKALVKAANMETLEIIKEIEV